MKSDEILAALPSLKPEALKAIQAACAVLVGQGATGEISAPAGTLGLLYQAFNATLGAELPYKRFKVTPAGKQFALTAPIMVSFVERAFPDTVKKKIGALALFRLILNLMVVQLRAENKTVDAFSLACRLQWARQAVDEAFPGYIQCGWGWMIEKQIRQKT